jgi:hypothetical protein
MPFGMHAGVPIAEVPPQYLRWMYQNCDFTIYPELQRAVEQRLGLPADPNIRTGPPPQDRNPGGPPATAKSGQANGNQIRHETGLDGFRAAFDRCRREVLIQYQSGTDVELEIVEHVFARVQAALGI